MNKLFASLVFLGITACSALPQPVVTNTEALACILATSELMKVTGDSNAADMQAVANLCQVALQDVQNALSAQKKAAGLVHKK